MLGLFQGGFSKKILFTQNMDDNKQIIEWTFRKGPPPSLTFKWRLDDGSSSHTLSHTVTILTMLELILCGGSADEPTKFQVSSLFSNNSQATTSPLHHQGP